MDNVISYEECWAKTTDEGEPGISVRDHCLNVGCVAEALLALLSPQLRRLIPPGATTLAVWFAKTLRTTYKEISFPWLKFFGLELQADSSNRRKRSQKM